MSIRMPEVFSPEKACYSIGNAVGNGHAFSALLIQRHPIASARRIVENCAHPTYRPLPRRYLELSQGRHSPNTLKDAFAFHTAYRETGSMLNVQRCEAEGVAA